MRAGRLLPLLLLGLVLAVTAAATSQDDYVTLNGEVLDALNARDFERVLELLEHMQDLWPEDVGVSYNMACAHALGGNPEEAFRCLDEAVASGYADPGHAASDVDLTSLREDPRFEALLERMRGQVERALAMRRTATLAVRAALEEKRMTIAACPIVWQDGHSDCMRGVRFSPNGRELATWADDGRVVLWDSASGESVGYLGQYSSSNLRVEYAEADRRVRVLVHDSQAEQLHLWAPDSERLYGSWDGAEDFVWDFDVSHDGQVFVTSDDLGRLQFWDTRGGRRSNSFPEIQTAPAHHVRFSPDGEWILTAYSGGPVRLFRAATGELVKTFGKGTWAFGHFTSQGARLLVHHGPALDWVGNLTTNLRTETTVEVWDLEEQPQLLIRSSTLICPPRNPSSGLCIDSAGTRLVTLDDSRGQLRLHAWDVDSGEALWAGQEVYLRGHSRVALSPDGSRLFSVFLDEAGVGLVQLREVRTGEVLATLRSSNNEARVGSVEFSIDSRSIHLLGGAGVEASVLFDGRDFTRRGQVSFGWTVYGGAFSPDGQRVAGVGYPVVGHVRDVSGDADVVILGNHALRARGLTASPGGSSHPDSGGGYLVCAAAGGRVEGRAARLWDPRTGENLGSLPGVSFPVVGSSFAPSGEELMVYGWHGILRFGTSDLAPLSPYSGRSLVHAEYGHLGRRILATPGGPSPMIRLINADTEQPIAPEIPMLSPHWYRNIENVAAVFGQQGTVFAMVPDADRTTNPGGTVVIRDAETGDWIKTLKGATQNGEPKDLRFSPDGRWLLTNLQHSVLWDTGTWEEVPSGLQRFRGIVWHSAFSSDSRRYALASTDGTARICSVDAKDGGGTIQLMGHLGWVVDVAFDPTDERVVTASKDGTARIWDSRDGTELAVLNGHSAGVRRAMFVDDGKRVATAGDDSTFRLWDAKDGRLLVTMVAYENDEWLIFEPGGHYYGSQGAAEYARVRVGDRHFPLSSYAVDLENKDRVLASGRGESVRPAPDDLEEAPDVDVIRPNSFSDTLTSRRFPLEVRASGEQEIVAIDVWQDGVPLDPQQFELVSREGDRSGWIATLTGQLSFPMGSDRTEITVRALDALDHKSWPTRRVLRHEPKGRLLLVALGVAHYADESLNLQYPLNDVRDLARRLEREAGSTYTEVETIVMEDEEVRQGRLMSLLTTRFKTLGAQDTLILFVAGHGVRTVDDDYFFLTPECTPDEPYEGIPGDILQKCVHESTAGTRILLIDTCQAGDPNARGVGLGGGLSLESKDYEEELDRGGGLYILGASTSMGSARESEGNGLFTSVLIEGLNGRADSEAGNGDKRIDMNELVSFLTTEIRKRTNNRQQAALVDIKSDVPPVIASVQD